VISKRKRKRTKREELQSKITENTREWLKTQRELAKSIEGLKLQPEDYNSALDKIIRSSDLLKDIMRAYDKLLQLND